MPGCSTFLKKNNQKYAIKQLTSGALISSNMIIVKIGIFCIILKCISPCLLFGMLFMEICHIIDVFHI